jgi:hypothetical protein
LPARALRMLVLLDQTRFRQQVFLELRYGIKRRLGVLLTSDCKIELILLLGEQLEELWHVPHVPLPFETRRPGPIPRTIAGVSRIFINSLYRRLTTACRILVLDIW